MKIKMTTIRLPAQMHMRLRRDALSGGITMNQLIIDYIMRHAERPLCKTCETGPAEHCEDCTVAAYQAGREAANEDIHG